MSLTELMLLALALSMDAFAVAVCKGLAMDRIDWKGACVVGLWFGGFQALMPVLGWILGSAFDERIAAYDHWIAFGLLCLIGVNMIRESRSEGEAASGSLAFIPMLVMAVATSIDALAVGVSFPFLQVDPPKAALAIGVITFCMSAMGVVAGRAFGTRYKSGAESLGGVILILLGTKILLEHLGILSF